jgi:phytoene dehydrogenase-like protein
MSPRVLVVGAGLSGLSAACLLARAGCAVTVFDKGHPGGRARTTTHHGAHLNLGPHALYRRSFGARILDQLGVPRPGAKVNGGAQLLWQGHPSDLPASPVALLGSPLLQDARWAFGRTLATLTMRPRPPGQSAADWVQELPTDASRAMFAGLIRLSTYACELEHLSAEAARQQLALVTWGVDYVDGGWATLVQGLVAAAERAGVRIERGAVQSVSGGQVTLGDQVHTADAVLVATPPAAFSRLTGHPVVHRPVNACVLDVVVRGDLGTPDVVLDLDAPRYASVHSRVADLAPDGTEVVHVARYLRQGETGVRSELEDWMSQVYPGWRAKVLHARFAPSLQVVGDLPAPDRARAGVHVAPGLWRAGDWVGERGMLADAAFASAERAALGILHTHGIRAA